MSLLSEEGFKPVRGYLTEGRFLTFEMDGYALTTSGNGTGTIFVGTKATPDHEGIEQRWVLQAVGSGSDTDGGEGAGTFQFVSAVGYSQAMKSQASGQVKRQSANNVYTVTCLGGGKGYSIADADGMFVAIGNDGTVSLGRTEASFQVYSVTYHS